MKADDIEKIVAKHDARHGGIIAALDDIQSRYTYLPEEALRIVSKKTGRSLVDIYGVATFFRAFSLKPRGKHLVSACLGTACHVRAAPAVVAELERQLRIKAGETTGDKEFTLETVNCLGACALGPIVVVDGHYFSHVRPGKVKEIIETSRKGFDQMELKSDPRIFPVEVSCPHCNHKLMDPTHLIDGYPSIRVTVAFQQKHGWLRLSCLYGSFNVESEHEIPADTVVNFFCPTCHAKFTGGSDCPDCGERMVSMIVRGGGVVQICPRRGCKGHMLDLA